MSSCRPLGGCDPDGGVLPLVHHVPQIDAANKLSEIVTAAQGPVLGHVRDTITEPDEQAIGEIVAFPARSLWARLDSNQGPTDYESAALTS